MITRRVMDVKWPNRLGMLKLRGSPKPLMETLLEGIARQQADVVIMDITGVPVVDTDVGNHLLQATQAAKLLGAQVILVGISAEVAQTIVQLGINLSRIVTLATLQAGIEYALDLQGLAIARRQPRPTTQ